MRHRWSADALIDATADVSALRRALLEAPAGLFEAARTLRDRGHGQVQSYSAKVFIPLTKLCRDYCHYCTFSRPPDRGQAAYLTPDEVLAIAQAGRKAGCTEALFTLGDKPELRYATARTELERLGHATTLSYLAEMCALVLRETGLLPHTNAGVMSRDDMAALRAVSASQGLMLESSAARLCARGGPHYRSPDKAPSARLQVIRTAGELRVPFTSGLLIGIGETRDERLDALFALRALHEQFGHLQEIIVQNFRAKAGTPMAQHPEPSRDELMWTIAAARLVFGLDMNIQAPPNLTADDFGMLIEAGINDWGGVSPVTIDHVNPEAAWPDLDKLRAATAAHDRVLVKRLPVYPSYARDASIWTDDAIAPLIRRASDATGFARADKWCAGGQRPPPTVHKAPSSNTRISPAITAAVDKALGGTGLSEDEMLQLFGARGAEFAFVCDAADRLRAAVCGEDISYVVNRNINYTNICLYRCGFCAFSKGDTAEHLRGTPYDLDHAEIERRVREAEARGATEVCLQGGIHPHYDGNTYLDICRSVRRASPTIHIHAFSPLEVTHGARTLRISVSAFLEMLKAEGLGTLPGTAAEILDDDVRAQICPDKLTTREWLDVMEAAHGTGLRTTSTIMFGHVDSPRHCARHLASLRALQQRTNGFTEFVPLPFVHMEAPMSLRGETRLGPTFRETVLMHAVARLALYPLIPNIQASWVKLGPEGAKACLRAGANDLGGTLMNESISRAAGASHGQEMPPVAMEELIRSIGRIPAQRTTLYGSVTHDVRARGRGAEPLTPIVLTAPTHMRRRKILSEASPS